MKISTCIHELLLENETVIIPGFGAFISHYKPAEILPENDEIKPPSKALSFNPKIRNNDGLLVGYIAENEGISHFDALKAIEKDRENIIYLLDKGEKITFENVGVLFRNENNEIEFESFRQENLLLDSFGLEATSLTPSEPEIEDKKHEEQQKPETDVETENTEAEETLAQETEESLETTKEPTVSLKENLVFSEAESAVPPKEENNKKKRAWVWFLLIFIPLIAAGIFLYSRQKKEMQPTQITEEKPVAENEKANQEGEISADTTKSDSTDTGITGTLQTETQETDSVKTTETSKQGNYYLVGGSFKEEENADKFMQEYNAEGYTPFKIGKRGNFYIIAIGRYNTEKEALAAQNEFSKKNPDSGTWIFKDETK